jgi:hypothetical protein
MAQEANRTKEMGRQDDLVQTMPHQHPVDME